ncbi:MAG: DNA-binding protein [Bacilli bacterium]|nr:DNA-binding protein [Bacilli bacterium]
MEEVLYFNELYDLYSGLLTDKQREYFEDYYFNNLSFSEMAENYDVSRNAIFKQIHIVTDKLKEYESILKLHEKREKLEKLIEKVSDDTLKNELNELF